MQSSLSFQGLTYPGPPMDKWEIYKFIFVVKKYERVDILTVLT